MKQSFGDRLKHAWNVFQGRQDTVVGAKDFGASYAYRPDRMRFRFGSEKTIVSAVYNRIAIDVASITIQHSKLDDNGRYIQTYDSGLNYCLNTEANIDQTGRAFVQDIVMSMLDEGCVAVVPVQTTINPSTSGSYDIKSLRVGKIVQWYPNDIKVQLYDQKVGEKKQVIVPKRTTCIIQNPLYAVMNQPNSTLQRLIRKLSLLDNIDEQNGAGKLDLIIQLPYVIKSESRREQAQQRRKDIETQLANSKYGVAYTDGTEHITQLNRSIDNNLMKQIEYLTSMLYNQLGLAQTIFDGTADESTMLNYHNRTVEPIISAIVDEMNRKFLTKTARSQNQKIVFFKDPFKLCPISSIAQIADSFTRNEILSPNEVRQIIGMKPSNDQSSDELRNRNMPLHDTAVEQPVQGEDPGMLQQQEVGSIMDTPISAIMPNEE